MLRLGFMPSDFHPVLLVLGDHSDIARFSEILSTFADNGAPVTLSNDGLISASGSEVKLAEHDAVATGRPGLWPEPGGTGLRWSLPREGARQFAVSACNRLQATGLHSRDLRQQPLQIVH